MIVDFLKKKHILFYVVVLFLLVYIAFIDSASFFHRYKVQKRYENLQVALEKLELENKSLEEENNRLKNDPGTWEKLAREAYGMRGQAEENYLFSEDKKSSK